MQDSVNRMEAQLVVKDDSTVYVEMSDSEVLSLASRISKQSTTVLHSPKTVSNIVALTFAYVPVLIFILVFVNIVNKKWNRAYIKLESIKDNIITTPERLIKWGMLKSQSINLWSRLMFYLILWGCGIFADAYLLSFHFTDLPYVAFIVFLFSLVRVLRRLAGSSYLEGYSDDDIVNNFESIANNMLIQPILNGIKNRIDSIMKAYYNTNNKEELS